MNGQSLTLLLSDTQDRVGDFIVAKLGTARVFRYNVDLWRDYALRVTGDSIEIENPLGWRIDDSQIAKVYCRAVLRDPQCTAADEKANEAHHMQQQIILGWRDMLQLFRRQGKLVLRQPPDDDAGKLTQLRVAAKHLHSTSFKFIVNWAHTLQSPRESVVKTFNHRFGQHQRFYSRKIDERRLDPKCPWFLTDFVDARWDVTVVVVRDECFAFSLDRSPFIQSTIDWREAAPDHGRSNWKPIVLPDHIKAGIFKFMEEMRSHYARLDFLFDGNEYTFLEANFGGEWGWLDPDGAHGLTDKIIHEIDPDTPRFSYPPAPPVA